MKAADVHIGATYEVMVSDKIAPILVESRNIRMSSLRDSPMRGYWACKNLRTMRTILVKTPERFRRLLTRAERDEINVPLSGEELRYYAGLAADDPTNPAWATVAEKVEDDVIRERRWTVDWAQRAKTRSRNES